jgi:hypothetical protein
MENESDLTFIGVLKNLAHTFVRLMGDLASLAQTEAKLAGQSVVSIFFLCFIIGSSITATWLSLSGLLLACLMYFHFSWIAAFSILTMLNLVVLMIICVTILKLKNNLSFRATRRQIRGLTDLAKGVDHGGAAAEN